MKNNSLYPGNTKGLEDVLKSLLEDPVPKPTPAKLILPIIKNGFYHLDKTKVHAVTSKEYRKYMKESGYIDLETGNGILIAKNVLKIDQNVIDAAKILGVALKVDDEDYIININYLDSKKLVEGTGHKLLTVGLMYKLFIPYIKELAQNGNTEAQATLNEMLSTKSEWLEDLIQNKNTLRIGNKKLTKSLTLPMKDGKFDQADINEFGYPTSIKQNGEFQYGYPQGDKRAIIRNWNHELGLDLGRGPSCADVGLGVRLAKKFS